MTNFLELPSERTIYDSEYFFVIRDGYPVSPGHCLIITKALRKTYFELSDEERTLSAPDN